MKNDKDDDEYVVVESEKIPCKQVCAPPTLRQQPTKVTVSWVIDFPVCVPCYATRPNVRCIHWKLCTAQMRYPMDKWNALGAWCQMTSAGKYTYTPNSLVI